MCNSVFTFYVGEKSFVVIDLSGLEPRTLVIPKDTIKAMTLRPEAKDGR
jgi:hypothetical protein